MASDHSGVDPSDPPRPARRRRPAGGWLCHRNGPSVGGSSGANRLEFNPADGSQHRHGPPGKVATRLSRGPRSSRSKSARIGAATGSAGCDLIPGVAFGRAPDRDQASASTVTSRKRRRMPFIKAVGAVCARGLRAPVGVTIVGSVARPPPASARLTRARVASICNRPSTVTFASAARLAGTEAKLSSALPPCFFWCRAPRRLIGVRIEVAAVHEMLGWRGVACPRRGLRSFESGKRINACARRSGHTDAFSEVDSGSMRVDRPSSCRTLFVAITPATK